MCEGRKNRLGHEKLEVIKGGGKGEEKENN